MARLDAEKERATNRLVGLRSPLRCSAAPRPGHEAPNAASWYLSRSYSPCRLLGSPIAAGATRGWVEAMNEAGMIPTGRQRQWPSTSSEPKMRIAPTPRKPLTAPLTDS